MTMSQASVDVSVERLVAWLEERLGLVQPITLERIAGGNSNLTFRVEDGSNRRLVLRRPPVGATTGRAHDVRREFVVMTALHGTAVPVPEPIAFCDDPEIGPMYVMSHVAGAVIRSDSDVQAFPLTARKRAGIDIIDALVELHRVDPADVDLDGVRPSSGYLQRQIDRWQGQFEKAQDGHTDDASAIVEDVATELRRRFISDGELRLIHGDYGIHNCLIGPSGTLEAIVDWELSTFGDPLADLGMLLAYWTDPDDDDAVLRRGPTRLAGFPRRSELLTRYADATGRDIGSIGDHIAFAHWKLACVFSGVAYRYRSGGLSDDDGRGARFQANVLRLARRSAGLLTGPHDRSSDTEEIR